MGKLCHIRGAGSRERNGTPTPEDLQWRQFKGNLAISGRSSRNIRTKVARWVPLAATLLDLISDAAFVDGNLRPVRRRPDAFREFMLDAEEENLPGDPDAALAFLVDEGVVEVAGDTITVPARFWIEAPNGGTPPAS